MLDALASLNVTKTVRIDDSAARASDASTGTLS